MRDGFSERLPPDLIFGKDSSLRDTVVALAKGISALPRLSSDAPVPHLLLYGGGVRDILLGERLRDADIQVYGVPPDRLEALLHHLFPGVVERAGKEYEILKVSMPRRGSRRVHDVIDISIPRAKTGGVSRFEEGDPCLFPLQATRYRDFTINSMSLDPVLGIVYDPYEGQKDLHARRLRLVDEQTFWLRGVHVLRGCQFVSRFGLTIEENTRRVMSDMSADQVVDRIPANAVREEIRKLLLVGRKPSAGLIWLHRFGLLERYFPTMIAKQSRADFSEWLTRFDRCVRTGRTCRMYPDHILIAQLALLFAPLCRIKREEDRIDAIQKSLSSICFSGFQHASVAEIVTLMLHDLTPNNDQVNRRLGRALPHRGVRHPRGSEITTASAEAILANRISSTIFTPKPAMALALASYWSRPFSEMLHLCDQAKQSSEDEPTSRGHHILSADEVDTVLGQDATLERRTEAMAELSARRYELVTRARARDYLKKVVSQGMNVREKVPSSDEIAEAF